MIHEPSTGEIGGIGAESGDCSSDRGERDGAPLLMENHEGSTMGASGSRGDTASGPLRHQPVTFDPHSGSVLSLKVSTLHVG